MRTIALVLGDNDYGNTFRPLLESLNRAIQQNPEMTPSAVEHVARAGIEFHYLAFQKSDEARHGDALPETDIRALEYLKQKLRVVFDEEAEADIMGAGHDSGAWYLELASGNVAAY